MGALFGEFCIIVEVVSFQGVEKGLHPQQFPIHINHYVCEDLQWRFVVLIQKRDKKQKRESKGKPVMVDNMRGGKSLKRPLMDIINEMSGNVIEVPRKARLSTPLHHLMVGVARQAY